jgi:hypothetical protein
MFKVVPLTLAFLWPLARGLSERGHDVTIISTVSPLKKAEVYRDGIRAFYLQESDLTL